MEQSHTHAVYNGAGEIVRVEVGPHRYLKCGGNVGDETHFVANGEVKEKTAFKYQVKKQKLKVVLQGLPLNAVVTVGGQSLQVDAAATVIEFDIPGTYTVTLNGLIGYLEEDLEVTVGDA
jgi:hypothetical protein